MTKKTRSKAETILDVRRENLRLKKEIEFKNRNIALLNQLNANMRAALRCHEVYFIILTGVTSAPGVGMNRGMLFIQDPGTTTVRGTMAIAPAGRPDDIKRFYEEVAEKNFAFDFYVEQFYEQQLKVDNPLNSLVKKLQFDRRTDNIVTRTLDFKKTKIVKSVEARDFAGMKPLARVMQGEYVVTPIFTKEQDIGVLVADNFFNRRKITASDVVAMQTLGDFASSVIVSARKYEEAEKLSVIDELTRLYNLRYLQQKMKEEIDRGKRYGRAFSVIMIDIDHFKNFNDKNGHLTGNKALMDLALIIRENIRSVDLPARYGGEEFVIVLPETSKKGALETANKLMKSIRAAKFIGEENQPGGKLTISAGVATYLEDGEDYESVLGAADKRLYLAKANGRNQVRG